jgi:dihydroorotate dehydrogenase
VTPRPQPGNPKRRLFRLPAHEAIINRMGFNNAGVDALLRNVQRASYRGVLGINIGRNKDTPNERAADDYLFCLERVYPLAGYVTVNISSPNTAGLRELQRGDSLRGLIGALREAQERLAARHRARKPMLLKIAPDLDDTELDTLATVLLAAGVDGVICTNTTLDRGTIHGDPLAGEAGGLSGRPLSERSTAVLRGMHARLGGKVPIIGVGGIMEGDHAAQKIEAGAKLVQIYTGLVYRGPQLVAECVDEIARRSGVADAA